ncbi:osteocalcin 2-like [Papaver somniferum]|uniref:osteocalcin 2-like n=1 Tax=Papaver somniferum TaxID=3469 RepID=UPI000E6FD400|nr:osteocalcin 2-like [Papaver somniferum]
MEEQKKSPVLVHLEQKNPALHHQEQKTPTIDHQEQKNPTLPVNVDDTFSFSSENESFQHQQDEQESDFEFGSITPDSPTSDSCKNSPADLLFFNGQLLPHVFPSFSSTDSSTRTSRTGSIRSKDSFTWASRSNSNNSRSSFSSSSSTTQTSSPISHALSPNPTLKYSLCSGDHIDLVSAKSKPIVGASKNSTTKKPVRVQPSTMPKSKWQFIKPAPILTATTDMCRNKKIEIVAVHQKPKTKKQIKTKKKKSRSARSWFGWRIFRSILWACRACHALEP